MKQAKRDYRWLALALALALAFMGCTNKKEPDSGDESTGSRPKSDYTLPKIDRTKQLLSAKEKNEDVVGWFYLPGTALDEPVVQTEDNEFYYRRNAKGDYAFSGSIWMDYEALYDQDPADTSQNVILYGHNLGSPQGVRDDKNGEKFAQLFRFTDERFAKNTPYFYFLTDEGEDVYEIFAVFYAEAITDPVPYHHVDYSRQRFSALIEDAKARSEYQYKVSVSPTDRIMTLSTCTYKYGTYSQNPDQRFVVMGRRMSPNEDVYPNADLTVNPQPKEPNFS